MVYVEVFYRVSNPRMDEAERRVRAFVEDLHKFNAHFQGYRIYRCVDDRSAFVHIMSFPDQEEQLRHTQSQHVKSFVEDMLSFCVEGPIYTELEEVAAIGPALEAPNRT